VDNACLVNNVSFLWWQLLRENDILDRPHDSVYVRHISECKYSLVEGCNCLISNCTLTQSCYVHISYCSLTQKYSLIGKKLYSSNPPEECTESVFMCMNTAWFDVLTWIASRYSLSHGVEKRKYMQCPTLKLFSQWCSIFFSLYGQFMTFWHFKSLDYDQEKL